MASPNGQSNRGPDADLLERAAAALGVSPYGLWQLLGLSTPASGYRWTGPSSGRRPGAETLRKLIALLTGRLLDGQERAVEAGSHHHVTALLQGSPEAPGCPGAGEPALESQERALVVEGAGEDRREDSLGRSRLGLGVNEDQVPAAGTPSLARVPPSHQGRSTSRAHRL